MIAATLARLVFGEIVRHPGRTVSLAFASFVAGFALAIATSVALLVVGRLDDTLSRLFPERRVVARARQLDVAFLRFEPGRITGATVEAVSALPGVERVMPQLSAGFPVSAVITLGAPDEGFVTDVILHGVPIELVEPDLPPRHTFRTGTPGTVPVLVSAFFLDLFNLGIAESAGIPKISPAAAIGREFDLVLGASSMVSGGGANRPRVVRCRVAGLTPQPQLVGLTVPLETLREWNAEFASGAEAKFSALHIDAVDAGRIDGLIAALDGMGLRGEAARGAAERHRGVLHTVALLALLMAGVVLMLAMTAVGAVAQGALRERRGSWGMMRALGVGPGRTALLALTSLLTMTVGGALLGALAAMFATKEAGASLLGALPGAAVFLGESLAVPPLVALAAGCCAGLVALLPAIPALAGLLTATPAELLSSR